MTKFSREVYRPGLGNVQNVCLQDTLTTADIRCRSWSTASFTD